MDINHTPLGQPKTGHPWIRYGLGFLFIALAFLALITYQIYNARSVATANAQANVKNLTMTLESKLEQALREAQWEVIKVATDIDMEAMRPTNANRYRPQISRWLESLASPSADSLALRVFDANGDSLYSSNDNEPAFNIADRNYFQRLKDDPSIHVLFSDVFFGRVTRQPAIFTAKAVRDRNGAFLGIALNGIELSSLHKYFSAIEIGTEGIVAVHRLDNGALVVRYPGVFEITNKPAMDLPIRVALLKDGRHGSMEFASPVDGIRRLYDYRRIGDMPFFVLVGTSGKDYLAEWRNNAFISLLTSLLFLASLAAVFLRFARAEARRGQTMAVLQTSEQSYRTLTEWSPEPLVVHDGSTFIYANPTAIKLFGARSAQDLVGKPIFDRVHPDFREIVGARMKLKPAQGGILPMQEVRFLKLDGAAIDVEVQSTSIIYDGVAAIQVALHDVTERKVAEEALRESERQLRESQSIAYLGSYVLDTATGLWKSSEILDRVFGIDATYVRSVAGWEALIHPDDRLMMDGYFKDHVLGQKQIFDKVYRIVRHDDQTPRWVHGIGKLDFDANGGLLKMFGTIQDITERKEAEDKIQTLAFSDPLTDLPNRRLLMDRLEQAMVGALRHGHQGAMLFVDLDDFKTINDTLGHDKGDSLLKQIAQRLITCVREGDTVARLGGDEFVVLVQNLSIVSQEASMQAQVVAAKILSALGQTYEIDGHGHHSTASIGVTLFGGTQHENIEEPMKRAELAMYQAKEAGRNTLRFFEPEMGIVATNRATMEAELREAVKKGQFLLYYQPQGQGNAHLSGVEALVRWQHPQRGLVSPAEFIPVAEASGLILPLGRWVLETACKQLSAWAARPEMSHLTMAVNVSARQFRQPDFVEEVLTVLNANGAKPERLKLELTESVLVDNVEDIIIKMNVLKAKGVGFSIDDFGTGYSSLSYLKRLPLDQLKIDQGFVRDILIDPNDAAIAKMVVALADSMGLSVIAEGVETEAQRDFLVSLGCKNYQGYLFSRPLPIDEFEAFAAKVLQVLNS